MARQRLSSKFIQFKNIKAKDIYNNFFFEDKLQNEEGVESVYNDAYGEATFNKVKTFKYKAPLKGKTDGYITARITDRDGIDRINFCGIQEVKLNVKRGTKAYYYQIGQALLYAVQYKIGHIVFIIISSVNYVDYFFIDENEIDREELLSILKDYPPSVACKKINIPKLKIYQMDMPTNADITNMLKDIYRHCINI